MTRGSSTEALRLGIGVVAVVFCCWMVVSSTFSTCQRTLWESQARLVPTSTPRYTPMSGLAYIGPDGADIYTEPKFKDRNIWRELYLWHELYPGTPVEILEAVWHSEWFFDGKGGRVEVSCYFYYIRVIGSELEGWVPQDNLTQKQGEAPPCEFRCFPYDCR